MADTGYGRLFNKLYNETRPKRERYWIISILWHLFWLEKIPISPPKASTPLEDPPEEPLNDPLNNEEPPLDDNEPLLDNDEFLAPLSTSSRPSPFGTLLPEATFSPPPPPPSTNLGFLTPLPTLPVTLDPLSYLNSPRTPLRGLNNGLNSRVPTPGLSECRVVPRSLSPPIATTEDVIEKGIMSGYETL